MTDFERLTKSKDFNAVAHKKRGFCYGWEEVTGNGGWNYKRKRIW